MNLIEALNQIQNYLNTNYSNKDIKVINLDIGGDYEYRNYNEIYTELDIRFTVIIKD